MLQKQTPPQSEASYPIVRTPLPKPRKTKSTGSADENEDSMSMEESSDKAEDGFENSDSDKGSVALDIETDAEVEAEEEAAAGDEADPLVPEFDAAVVADAGNQAVDSEDDLSPPARKKPGDCVVWTNGYFTLHHDPRYRNIKLWVVSRWLRQSEMGTNPGSKSVTPRDFGDDNAHPIISPLVLRSWMLWRAKAGDWVSRKPSRLLWWAGEEAKLKQDISALQVPSGRTGSDAADRLILGWTPSVFASES